MGVLILSSCQKDKILQPELSNNNTDNAKMIINRIDNFRTQMNSSERSGESILLDDAIWNLEALITYDKAFPDSASRDFKTMKSYYTLTVDQNNMVSEAEVQQVYNQMLDTLNYQLSLLDDDVKFAVFSDVELAENIGNTAYITVLNGYGTGYILGLYEPFASDDDWIWGTLGEELGETPVGKCDGTEVGVADGSNEIEYRLNNPIALPANFKYTDIVTKTAYGFQFPQPYPETGWRIYLDITATEDKCLYSEDLEYFLIEADDIIKTDSLNGGLRPPGKAFISIEITDDSSPGSGFYFHFYKVTYGKAISGNQG